ncbi:protein serine/threonine phosphatase [Aureococcus anophagefferens]|nr:protein serine/threonine phosphatase [Aureococcus anophagefferens]
MTRLPSAVFRYRVAGVQIEAFPDQNGVDVQFPWEPAPASHDQLVTVDAFDVDTYPVTNADYDVYLAESGYLPENAYNWLRAWAHQRNDSAFHRAASALARLEAAAPEARSELTVFAGAYYAAADFTVSAGGESRAIPVAAPDGLQTVAFTVKFTGTLATSWTLTDAFPSTDAPNINFQAAALKLA